VFHQAVPKSVWKRAAVQGVSPRRSILRLVLLPIRMLIAPFRMYAAVRRTVTPASVTILLVSIVSLNIVWGYPWSGMFAACASLMLVGWISNWLTRPKLEIGFSLPRSAPAGQSFVVVTHAKNVGRLPAMDLGIEFDAGKSSRGREADGFSTRQPHSVALIQIGQRIHRSGSIQFNRRGIWELPDVVVTSLFPFHLFRSTQRYASGTSIAITPTPINGDEDELARSLLDALGTWSHRLLSGDALDYTGSREYEVGMPVRRWDFSSWARLGRPIVREFQSPTIQLVTIVVDTSHETEQDPELVERVLSLAATAVTELSRKSVRVGLFVTHPDDSTLQVADARLSPGDCESLLIRMAEAQAVAPVQADRQIQRMVEQMRHTPLLVLTVRPQVTIGVKASALTVLRIDPTDPAMATKRRRPGNRRNRSNSPPIESTLSGGAA
jgi:uncharacterized protein (DUF58 family)